MSKNGSLSLLIVSLATAVFVPAESTRAQVGRTPTGSISGVVRLDGGSGQPVRRASIHLQNIEASGAAEASERIAISNDAGVFTLMDLPAGRYVLWATKNAYVSAWYGSRRPGESIGATSIVLADGQSIKAVDLKMVKGAVVTGTVYDDTGQPAVGSRVQVLQSRPDFRTGLRSLVAMGSGSGQMGAPPFTDNRGVYRIYGLPPGTYVVMAEVSPLMTMALRQNHIGEWSWLEATAAASGPATPPAASRPRVYAPIFFPGTLSAVNAAPIRLTSGEERSGLDIRLSMVPTSNLEGIIQLPSEVASNDVQIALLRNSDESSRLMAQRTPDASFRFAIPNLAPGTYTAVARALPRSSSDVNAVTEFTITSADQNITLQAQPGPKVSGRVSLQPSATQVPTSLAGIQIALSPVTTTPLAALGTPTATTNASGTFAFRAVLPGQYRVRITANGANLGAGWILRSATVKNQDVLDTPITIGSGEQIDAALTFTERLSELSGSLVDASGRPAPDYVVVVFSSESGTWFPASRRIAAMRPGLDGRYRFTNLPAGQYLLGAVTDVEQFQWFDPEFLAQLKPASIAITLSETAPTVQNLRIGTK